MFLVIILDKATLGRDYLSIITTTALLRSSTLPESVKLNAYPGFSFQAALSDWGSRDASPGVKSGLIAETAVAAALPLFTPLAHDPGCVLGHRRFLKNPFFFLFIFFFVWHT